MSSSCDSSMSLYLLMKISGENCAWNREVAQLVSVLDGKNMQGIRSSYFPVRSSSKKKSHAKSNVRSLLLKSEGFKSRTSERMNNSMRRRNLHYYNLFYIDIKKHPSFQII